MQILFTHHVLDSSVWDNILESILKYFVGYNRAPVKVE